MAISIAPVKGSRGRFEVKVNGETFRTDLTKDQARDTARELKSIKTRDPWPPEKVLESKFDVVGSFTVTCTFEDREDLDASSVKEDIEDEIRTVLDNLLEEAKIKTKIKVKLISKKEVPYKD